MENFSLEEYNEMKALDCKFNFSEECLIKRDFVGFD